MTQRTIKLMLMLLAVIQPTAWAFAQQRVTIVATGQGSVVADKPEALAGETVTLTVSADEGWRLKKGSLLVEQVTDSQSDSASVTRSMAPAVGSFVAVSRLDDNSYTFVMPANQVEVSAAFVENSTITTTIGAMVTGGTTDTTIDVTVSTTIETETGEAIIDKVVLPEGLDGTSVTIIIPATLAGADGQEHPLTGISSGAMMGNTNVTDIYLPDTDEPLVIEPGALTLDNETGAGHHVATIHTPLQFLDDYALMASLSEHYQEGLVTASVTASHRYFTFSCGVDVKLPDALSVCIAQGITDSQVEIKELPWVSIVMANNGVLIDSHDAAGNNYDVVAVPSEKHPSGSQPATGNAHTYEGNLLEPVIEGQHYGSGDCYILAGNQFHLILEEGADAKVPACKAVLRLTQGQLKKQK